MTKLTPEELLELLRKRPNTDYWKNRFALLEKKQNDKGLAYFHELENQFNQAAINADQELAKWYGRFSENEGITLSEARRRLNTQELKEFRMDVEAYITKGETLNYSDKWSQELERASTKFHVTRLEAIKLQMQQQVEHVYGYELDTFGKKMEDVYKEGYLRTAFTVESGLGIAMDFMKIDQPRIDQLLVNPWAADGRNFSDRIWRDKEKLMAEMPTLLKQGLIKGDSYREMSRAIEKRFSVSQSRANNLVRTESAFFSSSAQGDCFKDLGVEKYEILATLDKKTSEICRNLDGKVFDANVFEAGVTTPPFHGRCRTTTVPHFDDKFEKNAMRAARNEEGKTYCVPAEMTYSEWKKSFVKNDARGGFDHGENGIIKLQNE